jgi:serine/threonine protein phosphatase PrpC
MPPKEQDLQKVARDVICECIYGKNVKDNITVIIVSLNRGVFGLRKLLGPSQGATIL